MNNDLVNEHRQAIFLSGNLSDFQLKNLKTWPFLVFNDLKDVKIEYDFTDYKVKEAKDDAAPIGSGSVIFDFTFKPKTKIPDKIKKQALDNLKLWTQFLFWSDTNVFFKRNGKVWK